MKPSCSLSQYKKSKYKALCPTSFHRSDLNLVGYCDCLFRYCRSKAHMIAGAEEPVFCRRNVNRQLPGIDPTGNVVGLVKRAQD